MLPRAQGNEGVLRVEVGGRCDGGLRVGVWVDIHIDGGAGDDTVSFRDFSNGVNANLETGSATGSTAGSDTLTGIENIVGGAGNDTLIGSEDANTLSGGAGNDTIGGGGGDDVLSGGAGSDLLQCRRRGQVIRVSCLSGYPDEPASSGVGALAFSYAVSNLFWKATSLQWQCER